MKSVKTRGFAVLLAMVAALLLHARHGAVPLTAQAPAPDALSFFKNYFVTGDYVEGGVGLRGRGVDGIATGSIELAGAPQGVDIVAAFLYWQVVTKDTLGPDSGTVGASFKGYPLTSAVGPVAKVLGQAGTAPCWSSGGGTGSSGGVHRTYTYRADVLRYFDTDEAGKPIVNGPHEVRVPDSGPSGNGVPTALGASLVVVYRDSTLPLNAIVLYDGGFTVDNATRTLNQAVRGFYQPSGTPDARITYLVGSGQANKNENLLVNGTLVPNPFVAADGESWDSLTVPVNLGATPSNVSEFSTVIDTDGVGGADCLSVAAIAFKTAVLDTDGDGLLDVWESATTPLVDPNNQPLPLLSAAGADPLRQDLFIEVGYMHTGDQSYTYGGVAEPAHTHLPSHDALKLVGDAFRDGPGGIRVHFDVGPSYPSGAADQYIIRDLTLARGGDAIDEMRTVCARGETDPPWVCQFSDNPGTVGWKTGFRFIRDEVLSGEPAPVGDEDDVCDLPGSTCERRFDRNRTHMFHYALFAHATGVPKSGLPCLAQQEVDGVLMDVPVADVDGVCAEKENPDFRVPRTITGVGDFPGGDVLVTLGAFDDIDLKPVGTPFMQASTLMHELGHNMERRHGGEAFEPNCKPTYLSVMNYLYQLRGLLDDSGKPHLNFSGPAGPGVSLDLDETSVLDLSLGALPYRIGWYAPLAGSYLEGRASAAGKHCDGTPLLPGESMVRVDARTSDGIVDWNANGVLEGPYAQDLNFNGRTLRSDMSAELLEGSDDWTNLKLNQIGARRNIGARYVNREGELSMGPLSLDTGRGDWGRGDWGRGDWGRGDWGRGDWGLGDLGVGDTGRGDWGRGDWGRGDWGRGDWGRGDWGRGDWGRGDWGGGDLFQNDPDNPGGELDYETAIDLAKTPPNEFRACVIGVDCDTAASPLHAVRLDWTAPTIGAVVEYRVYRVPGATLLPGATWSLVGSPVPAVAGVAEYGTVDASALVDGAQYTYFAVAIYADGTRSDVSNLVTITAVDDVPAISTIADQTILANTSTGPLAFTLTDEDPASVTLTGTSSNTTLVPNAGIVFGGSGASRTVTVTPALNQSGSAVITIAATDAGGRTASTSFALTVQTVTYTFTGFMSPLAIAGTDAVPSDSGTVNFGKAIPLKWSLSLGGTAVSDLGSLNRLEAVPGTVSVTNPTCSPNGQPALLLFDEVSGRPTGNSTYRYDSRSNQFVFNWDTAAASRTSCYRIRLTLADDSAARVTVIRFK